MIPKKEVTVKPKNFFKLYLIICFVKIYIKIVSWIVFDIKYEEMFIKVKTFALRKTLKKKKSYFRYINLSKAHSGSHTIHQKNQIWLKNVSQEDTIFRFHMDDNLFFKWPIFNT